MDMTDVTRFRLFALTCQPRALPRAHAVVAPLALMALAACTPEPKVEEGPPPVDTLVAVIDISDQEIVVQRTYVAEKKTETYRWPVSTGRAGYETGLGNFHPTFLDRDHRSTLYDDAPMPWSVFFNGDEAVHGTTEVRNLGRPASHGCVRVHPSHAEVFFKLVQAVGRKNTVISVVE